MKRLRKCFAVLLAFAVIFTTIDPAIALQVQASTEAVATQGTLEVDLTDGMTLKASKKTVTVIARDVDNRKVSSTLTFDGENISYEWDDEVKTSYVLDFTEKKTGDYKVIVTAGEQKKEFTIHYQKAAEGEFIGYATMDVELFSIDKGYLIEPVLIPLYEGESAAAGLVRLIETNGYGANYTGSMTSGFYLSSIYGANYKGNKGTATKDLDASGAHLDAGVAEADSSISFDETDYTEGSLGEFDYNYQSGWMYAVNGSFPNVGFSSYYLVPGDVVRVQFTVAYGRELGGSGSLGGSWGDLYPVANKDSLTALISKVNSAKNAKELKEKQEVKDALLQAVTVLDELTASQAKVDEAEATLKAAVFKEEVKALSLNKTELTLENEQSEVLEVSYSPEKVAVPVLYDWASSDNTVAVVEDGKVTAVGAGEATITVSIGDEKASCKVSVPKNPIEKIDFKEKEVGVLKNKTAKLNLEITPANTTDDRGVTYTSSDETVAKVSSTGVVTGVAPGSAVITATIGKFTTQCEVTVSIIPLEKITLAKRTVSVKKGKSTSISRTLLPSNQTDGTAASAFNWKSEDATIATFTGSSYAGTVKGIETGTTTVTVESKYRDVSAECFVSVIDGTVVNTKGITFEEARIAINEGQSLSVSATVTPENATDPVLYISSDDKVAIVNAEGQVTGVAEGTATITAYSGSVSECYEVTVEKKEDPKISFTVTPEDATVYVTDADGTRIWDVNGVYNVEPGKEYTCVISKNGYITEKKQFVAEEKISYQVDLKKAEEKTYKQFTSDWNSFRNGADNSGITNAETPTKAAETELLWSRKVGTGWGGNAAGTPILVGDSLVCMQGKNLFMFDKKTGEPVVDQSGKQICGTMVASSPYNIVSPTYADGMIFVGLSNGVIQAFDAETLESLWVYTDSLKGQPNSPIIYSDGYVYTGFWNSETKDAHYVCVSVTDEDTSNSTEAKEAVWTHTVAGGFYWSGAYVTERYVYVGTDDGTNGSASPTAKLQCYDKFTGKLVDQMDGFIGDIRCNIAYDKDYDRMFFTTKGGYLYSIKKNTDGTLQKDSLQTISLGGASTSTPSIYNGRLYVGVSGSAAFGTSGHFVQVIDLANDGTMTEAYTVSMPGYPQTSGMISTAYVEKDGYNYVYFTYNMTPGGIVLLKDKKGQKDAISEEIFTPTGEMAQYCICSVIASADGVIYYKNDSGYMMALHSNKAYLENVNVTGGNAVMDKGTAFDGSVTAHEIVVKEGTKSIEVAVTAPTGVTAVVSGEAVNTFEVPVEKNADFTIVAKQGSDTKIYTFRVREQSDNADLAVLRVNTSNSYTSSILEMIPAFDQNQFMYRVTADSTKTFWNVWAGAEDSNATVQVYPISPVGSSTKIDADGTIPVTAVNSNQSRYAIYFAEDYTYATVRVVVTAENGTATKTYMVTLDRVNGTVTPTPEITATPEITPTPVTSGTAVTGSTLTGTSVTGSTVTGSVVTGDSVVTETAIPTVIPTGIPSATNPSGNQSGGNQGGTSAGGNSGSASSGTQVTEAPEGKTDEIVATENPAQNDKPQATESVVVSQTATPQPTKNTETETTVQTPVVTQPTEGMMSTQTPKTEKPVSTTNPSIEPTNPVVVETVIPETQIPDKNTQSANGATTGLILSADQNPSAIVNVATASSISLNKAIVLLYPTQKTTLTATVLPETASGVAIVWKSSNKKVVTVSKKGVVTAKKKGSANITATTEDGKLVATCKVKVKKATIVVKKRTISSKKKSLWKLTRLVELVKGDKITSVKIAKKNILKKQGKNQVKIQNTGKTKITFRTKFGAKKTVLILVK